MISSSSLRPNQGQSSSPTSSTSSKTTTPTSPSFRTHDTSLGSLASSAYSLRQQPASAYSNNPSTPSRSGTSFSSLSSGLPSTPTISVLSWAPTEVATFLASIKCGHLVPVFESNDITGQVILELDMSHLKEMGVDRVGDRVRVLAGLKALKKSAATPSWRGRSETGGSVSGESSRRGPTVVVTRGEESEGSSFGQSSSRRLGESSRSAYPTNGNGYGPAQPTPTSSQTNGHSEPSSSSAAYTHNRTNSGQTGHRPAPLHISQPSAATDPRLPQAYQPNNAAQSNINSNLNTSSLRSGPAPTNLSRSVSPAPSSMSSGSQRLPAKSASSSSLRDPSLRPPPSQAGPLSSSVSSSIRRRPSDQSNSSAASPPAAGSTLSTAPVVGLPSNPRPGQVSHGPSSSMSGGSFEERRATLAKEREGKVSTRPSAAATVSHRKTPSAVNTGSFPNGQPTVVLGANGRPAVSGPVSFHPFATAAPATPSTPSYPMASYQSSNRSETSLQAPSAAQGQGSSSSSGGYSVGRGPFSNSVSSSSGVPFSLEDLKRKCIKFINAEDGHSRVVDLANCEGGVEVMEKVLKKFGKWNGARRDADQDSDDDGAGANGLRVDGWGIFLEGYSGEGLGSPLTEAELLSICHAPPDSPSRERGLTLKRIRKANRKAMESFFGETPPDPKSPTTSSHLGDNSPKGLLPSSRIQNGSNMGAKKMNRASTVSVMSGLGVPLGARTSGESFRMPSNAKAHSAGPPGNLSPDIGGAGSSPSARSPSAGSFLNRGGRKMYNFFGHRPPSELISNHLADYFPYVQKKVLERTARNSMLRISSGSGSGGPSASLSTLQGGSSLPGTSWSDEKANPSSRLSTSSFGTTTHTSPKKKRNSVRASKSYSSPPNRQANHRVSGSPPQSAIPEESFFNANSSTSETGSVGIPRLSISTDDGTTYSESESDNGSTVSRPPLLPPLAPSDGSLSDSLGVYSSGASPSTAPTDPNSAVPFPSRERRGSNASASTSRLSMISRYRKSRDKSDTASMLTVDEITAHVESKRVSMVSFAQSESDEDGFDQSVYGEDEDEEDGSLTPAPFGRRSSRASTIGATVVSSEDGDDEEDEGEEDYSDEDEYSDEEEEDEDEDEDEEEEEVVGEDEYGKAFTSTGGKRSIKWMKGALIGSGSFGSVFLGMDAQNGLLMAVKQVDIPTGVSTNEERKKAMLSALEREIELLKELQHENIVQYLDSSIDANHLNIFLEYVPGGSVSALLGNYGAFEEALVRTFIRQTLQGLVYLHDRDIIHRDIKGANILVDNKGGIKISDFGISKKVESNLLSSTNQRKSLQGTVFWMAPEVVRQTAHTLKADIWSIGCLVVEMLTGQQPWGALNQMQVMFKIGASGRPTFPPDITDVAVDFLNKTFILDHLERPSATELLAHPFITEALE